MPMAVGLQMMQSGPAKPKSVNLLSYLRILKERDRKDKE